MTAPQIHAKRRTFSASRAVEVQNSIITGIKTEDSATWTDIGRVLGKSEDRAAAYANTASPIDLPTFLAGCDQWGGRFADPLLALAGLRTAPIGAVCTTDDTASLTIAQLLPAIIEAERDGVTTVEEIAPSEALIRRVHHITAAWLEQIAEHRGSGVVSLPIEGRVR